MATQTDRIVPDLAGHHGEILIVDDSATSRTLLGATLQRRGYQVRFAQNGEEALTVVRAAPPDLILLDLILPGLDGYKVARRLRRDPELPYVPIILITTFGDTESKVRGLEAGADDFVVKPPDEAELLARVAALLRLKHSQQDLVAEKSKIDLLYQISRELSAELDLDTLLTRILGMTIAAAHASRGSIILLGEQEEALRHISIHGDTVVDVADEVWERIVREGLAGWVIRYSQGTIVSDTQQDPRWLVVNGAHVATRAALAVPLIYAGQVSGVLTLTHDDPGRFTPADLELVISIASQGAVATEKARLYQKEQFRARQLLVANEVGRQVTSILDPNQLLQEVARLICQAFDYYHVEVALREGDELVFQEWGWGRREGMKASPARLPLSGPGIAVWAARSGTAVLVPDVRHDPRYRLIPDLPDTVAELVVPLQAGEEILGVLDVQSDRYGQLSADAVPLLETLASQVTVALKNARLFQERGRRITELAILNEISRALASALDLGRLVEVVYEQASRLFDTTNFYVASYDDSTDEWETLLDLEQGQRRPPIRHKVRAGLTGHIIRHKAPLLFRTQAEMDSFLAQEGIQPIGAMAQSWLGVPLIAADKVVGMMAVQDYAQENRYDEQDLALLCTIASQAAVAIENARLYTETERERGKMTAVLTGTTDAVVVTDSEGKVLLCNPAAERTFGVRAQDAVGRPLAVSCPNQLVIELFQHVIEGVPPYVAEIPLPGERTLYASVSRVPGVGYVAVMQDITHLKKLDRMKSEFVSTVSHDLRNPLSIIHGYAELLLQAPEVEQQKEFAGRIKVVSSQMADLIEDLLNLGKIETGVEIKRVPCQLEEVIREAVDAASFQAQMRELSLRCEVAGPLPMVLGDPLRLRQVLDNLLSNGLKYTPAGGSVTIHARHGSGSVIVEVEDTGLGIPREAQPRLFAKFYRVNAPDTENIPGTGLGLAIVKAIVEQHGGHVWVRSEVGKGSTFGFSLPIYSGEE
jgi:PAS domain S-box-containing protein